jgi:hypothetical protein
MFVGISVCRCQVVRNSEFYTHQRNIFLGYVDTITLKTVPTAIKLKKISVEEFQKLTECYICYSKKGNSSSRPCGHKDICLECISRLDRCPQCRRNICEIIILEI